MMFFNIVFLQEDRFYLYHLYHFANSVLKTVRYSGTGQYLTYTRPVPPIPLTNAFLLAGSYGLRGVQTGYPLRHGRMLKCVLTAIPLKSLFPAWQVGTAV